MPQLSAARERLARNLALAVPVLVFALCTATVVVLYWRSPALFNQYDDGYITYRYAIQLARGHGLVYNVGERIDSASSLVYAVLLGTLYRVGLHDLERVATWICVAATAGAATTVFAAVRWLTRNSYLSLGLAVLTAMHGLMSGWAISGMEVTPYAFLVALFAYRYFIRADRGPLVAALACIIVLTRIEGVILLACAALVAAIDFRRLSGSERRNVVIGAAAVTLTGVAFMAFKLSYYGAILPDSFRFKEIWTVYRSNPANLRGVWENTSSFALLLAVGGLGCLPDYRARLGIGAYVALSVVSLTLGPNSGWARYSVHLLPIVMILAGACMNALLSRLRLFAATMAALTVWQTYSSATDVRAFMENLSYHQRCRKEVGAWLEAARPSRPVLSSDIGAIAYKAIDVSFIDAVGLTSPDVLRAYRTGGSLDPIFDSKKPELVADTWYKRGAWGEYQALSVLAAPSRFILKRVSQPSYLRERREGVRLCECRSPQGLVFAASKLVLRKQR